MAMARGSPGTRARASCARWSPPMASRSFPATRRSSLAARSRSSCSARCESGRHGPAREHRHLVSRRNEPMAWSLLIRGGTVIDGSGAARRAADVAVEEDRIAAIAPRLEGAADRVIDASNHVVAPGFIDAHSHSDLFYLACPSSESKVRQGCTTEVVGMCSFSPAPIAPGRARAVRDWAGGIGASLDLRWETFGQYLDALRAVRPSINVVHFVGHGALRLATVGAENRPVTPEDLRAMQRLLDEATDSGAHGYSTGLVYPPSAYA